MAERCLTPDLHLLGGRGLDQAQNASYPPVAGHDDPADHPAAPVVVGPHVGPQWFADPLAVGVAAAALGTAHALVVQHGVHVHAAPLPLQASLGRDERERKLKLPENFSMQLNKTS